MRSAAAALTSPTLYDERFRRNHLRPSRTSSPSRYVGVPQSPGFGWTLHHFLGRRERERPRSLREDDRARPRAPPPATRGRVADKRVEGPTCTVWTRRFVRGGVPPKTVVRRCTQVGTESPVPFHPGWRRRRCSSWGEMPAGWGAGRMEPAD